MTRRDSNLNIGITSTFDGRGFKSAEGSAKAMERELNKLEQEQRRRVQMQKQAESEMQTAFQQREEAQRASYRMQAQAEREMNAELQAQAAVRERLNERQRAAMETAGKMMLGVSAAAAAGFALTAKAAMDWESAWAGVTKTVDGSAAELEMLEGQLRGLARSMPASHAEIAAVAEAAGQLGVARENVASFTKTMIDLGETTNLTADEAATSLAQLMNIMGTSQDDVGRLGATIVALGNDGASTERDIVQMAQRIAGAGKLVGATEGEVLALASALSSMGVTAELGGGVASRVLQDLYSAVQEGGDALEGFAEVAGVSAQQFAAHFREDPVAALALFAEGLNRVAAGGGNVITTLTDLGIKSSEEQRILLQLKANADLVTDSLNLQATAWDENTALIEEANKRYETTEARLQTARNQINDAAIDIGGNFLPVVAEATEAVGALATWFGSLPDGVQQWVTWLGAGATAAGLLGGTALLAVPKLNDFRRAVDDLNGGTSRVGRLAGGAASVLAGPWGLAIAGATLAIGWWAKEQGEARQRAEALSRAIDDQTGKFTDSARELAFNELSNFDTKPLDAAERLGIGLSDLVDMALDPASQAYRDLQAAATETNDALAQSSLTDDGSFARLTEDADDYAAVLRALEGTHGTVGDATELARQRREALNETEEAGVGTATDAAGAQEELAGAFGESTDGADNLAEAIDAVIEAMRTLNDPTLSLIDAQMAWEETLDSISGALEENGQNLDITTEAGRANQEVLNGMARDAMALAEALIEETGSEEEFRSSLASSRESLAKTAQRFGMTEEQAWAYVDSVLAIPEEAVTNVVAHTAGAEAAIQGFIERYDGKTIAEATVDVFTRLVDSGVTRGQAASGARYTGQALNQLGRQADGSVLEFYGNGGLREHHVAQIAPAGAWRVWAEDETGGEAYIPLAPAKRDRSEAILGEVAHRFGMYVGRFADGAVVGGAPAQAQAGPAVVANIYGVPVDHAEETAQALSWELRRFPTLTGYAGVND